MGPDDAVHTRSSSGWSGGVAALKGLAALLFLNAAVSFDNWWPTPWVRLDPRLAPELVALWVLVLIAVRATVLPSPRVVSGLAAGYTLLILGRYADVTPPAWFGRAINLAWDGPQIPRFLAVVTRHLEPWQVAAIVAGGVLSLWVLYRTVRLAVHVVARDAAPLALASRAALGATAAAVALVAANSAGVEETYPVVSRPVSPALVRQAGLLLAAVSPTRPGVTLPPSPAFDSDLGALEGRDVRLIFLESYGATVFDNPDTYRRLAPARAALDRTIESSGRQVVSAYVRSPTFGGASDLAHLSLLTGIDLSDPRRHDAILGAGRPNLIQHFRARGYKTFGLYPAVSWEWPEHAAYGFDHYLDGRDLGYRGPRLGFWWIPDQFSIARFDELHPIGRDSPPRLVFFPTITSHAPFRPVPPYQPDWARVLTPRPYDDPGLARALADPVDWSDLAPAYLRAVEYTYTWLAGYLGAPAPRDYVMLLIGDHQPVGGVTGPNAPWDVPVHVITSSAGLVGRLASLGFQRGLEPRRPVLGGMHDLTGLLLDAFDAAPPPRPLRATPAPGATDAEPARVEQSGAPVGQPLRGPRPSPLGS